MTKPRRVVPVAGRGRRPWSQEAPPNGAESPVAPPSYENATTDWRAVPVQGSVRDRWLFLTAVMGLILGILGARLVDASMVVPAGAGTIVLWAVMLALVIASFLRSPPAGLFELRTRDLLVAPALGIALRLTDGMLSGANSKPFPTLAGDGVGTGGWSAFQVWSAALIGPVVEEAFFRGLLLVAGYQLARRWVGGPTAGAASAVVSAGLFVSLHAAFAPLGAASVVQLLLVGSTCSVFVLLSGRFWGALVVHAVYNCTFLILAYAGSMLA